MNSKIAEFSISSNVLNKKHTPTLSNSITFSGTTITAYYQNCRGLNGKVTEFSLSLLASDYDIVALTETWLKPSVLSTELFGDSYFVFRCDRSSQNSSKRHGGGVIVAIKCDFQCNIINFIVCDTLEIVIVKMFVKQIAIYIICVYIPSNSLSSVYDTFINAISTFFNNIAIGDRDMVLILGDFNVPSCAWVPDSDGNNNILVPVGNHVTANFFNSILSNGMFQVNSILNFMNRLLDLVFINNPDCTTIIKNPLPLVKIDKFYPIIDIIFYFS